MTPHEIVTRVLAKKIREVKQGIAAIEKELRALRSMNEASQNKKTEGLEDTLYSLTFELHKLEKCHKGLSPTKDEAGNIATLGDLIKVLSEEKNRKAEGRRNYLAQLAAEKERERLSQPIQYADGQWDIPLLTPETVSRLKAEEENGKEEDS